MPWVSSETARAYREAGWWADDTVLDAVRRNAAAEPDSPAYTCDGLRVSWSGFQLVSQQLAQVLVEAGVRPDDRVAVCMRDSIELHACFVAVEHAAATIAGIGARAGRREIRHLLGQVGAALLVTGPVHDGADAADLVAGLRAEGLDLRHLVVCLDPDGLTAVLDGVPVRPGERAVRELAERRRGPDDLYLINSTSGTTGLPKAVLHTQNRWTYFHRKAVANGALGPGEVILGAVPAPFGFGLWTSHITPIRLGAHTVLLDRFTPRAALEAIERERVTMLCCVSTQFIMMLTDPDLDRHDLSSLRVVFTGGETVPYERALEFERRTGAAILQFYGSNETGLLSGTTLADPPERRLRTAGRVAPEMRVRLFDGDRDVTGQGRGQPACKGPATGIGYLDDEAANEKLFTPDGWMLMGDICEIDDEGYLTVVGRLSDFVVRGGKNISLPVVENDVLGHPAVAHAAAVGMPDPVFGERVCVYVELRPGASLTLDGLRAHLAERGVSKELYPERLIALAELPRSSGAKVAKGELRADIARRIAAEAEHASPTTGER
ncbi:class I adenylate-forming enzyme family protein [Actinocorallia libanotica]|uniref:Cyclohexanecarboxylate-CoA ligase n=1 Tax=Actinocorallia libanotica TaxID=46162 RepID=A0ABN1RS43_9ACTN